jgi:hypothetical protein
MACVYFLPNLLTQNAKVNEKPKVTKFNIADVAPACSTPNVYNYLTASSLLSLSPWNNCVATPVL